MIWIVGSAAVLTWFAAWVLTFTGIRLFGSALAAPLFVIFLWVVGSIYISTPLCGDIAACDGGGMLAFTANMVVLLAIVAITGLATCLLYRIVKASK